MSKRNVRSCSTKGVFQRILVAVDDSEPAQWATQMAAKLAASHNVSLAFVHVIPGVVALTPDFATSRSNLVANHLEIGQAILSRAAASIDTHTKPELIMMEGEPSKQII